MKKLLTVLLALAMAFTMVFATAASAEDGYKDSITGSLATIRIFSIRRTMFPTARLSRSTTTVCWAMTTMATSFARWRKAMKRPRTR